MRTTIIVSLFIILYKYNKIKVAAARNENTLIYGCHHLKNCNGHGTCNHAKGYCECYKGWGSNEEVINILSNQRPSPDCSKRVCPIGKSWSNRIVIKANDTSTIASEVEEKMDLHGILSECSNSGYCDREHGLCRCYDGFRGTACEYRNLCNNDCSGHGTCTSLKNIGIKSRRNYYTEDESGDDSNDEANVVTNRYWEYDRIYGCICDSSWIVGLGDGEVQQTEWFGSDCSNRHCPSGDNPDTAMNETDCSGIIATTNVGSVIGKDGNVGSNGNLCHYDCSGKGTCDYSTGICYCFEDNFGPACEFRRIR